MQAYILALGGTAIEYLRNDVFDANNGFANSKELRTNELRQSAFGRVLVVWLSTMQKVAGHKIEHNGKGRFEIGHNYLVRKGGLEPPRFNPPDPKLRRFAGVEPAAEILSGAKDLASSGETIGAKGGTRTPTVLPARS